MDNKSDRRKHHLIYKTTCLVSGRWYLGMHSTNVLDDGYYGSGTHLQNSLKKHGKENHVYEIIESLPSRAELRLREKQILTEDFISDPLCMNIRFSCSAGNDPGFWQTKDREATSKKISASSKKMWEDRKADPTKLAEHIAKINKPEHVQKRAEAIKAKAHKRTPEQKLTLAEGQAKYYSGQSAEDKLAKQRKGTWAHAKTWKIESESGEIKLVQNIQAFAIENGIKVGSIYKTEQSGSFRGGYRIVGRL